jgi:hypothetical protein
MCCLIRTVTARGHWGVVLYILVDDESDDNGKDDWLHNGSFWKEPGIAPGADGIDGHRSIDK